MQLNRHIRKIISSDVADLQRIHRVSRNEKYKN